MNEDLRAKRMAIQLREKLAPLPVYQRVWRAMTQRSSLQARLLRTLRSTDVLDYIWRYRCGRLLGGQYSQLFKAQTGAMQ